MIHFVDLRAAGISGVRFGFWDTVRDCMMQIGDDQGWEDLDDLRESVQQDQRAPSLLARLTGLCPPWVSEEEPTLHEITATVCSMCLDGAGGECHTPGCVFIYHDGPASKRRGATLRQLLREVGSIDGVTERIEEFPSHDQALGEVE